jgi:hypothetical protein
MIEGGEITLARAEDFSVHEDMPGDPNDLYVYVSFSDVDVQAFRVLLPDVVSAAVANTLEWAESREEILGWATGMEANAKRLLTAAAHLCKEAKNGPPLTATTKVKRTHAERVGALYITCQPDITITCQPDITCQLVLRLSDPSPQLQLRTHPRVGIGCTSPSGTASVSRSSRTEPMGSFSPATEPEYTERLPEMRSAFAGLPARSAIIDGELFPVIERHSLHRCFFRNSTSRLSRRRLIAACWGASGARPLW